MIISGFIKTDLVNFPKVIAASVFTQGCNFSCPYCHNPSFVRGRSEEIYTEEHVLKYLEKHKIFIDGLVISGGEPTLNADLPAFIAKAKDTGLKVKLDTNGTNPEMVANLLESKSVDYVAMDIKTTWRKYHLTGCKDLKPVMETFLLLKKANIPCEFRTTCPKGILEESDFEEIAAEIQKDNGENVPWYLQIFNNTVTLDASYCDVTAWSREELETIKENLKSVKENIFVRG